MPDHIVNLETLSTPYPYTRDGERRWQPFTHWPDPYAAAKAIGTAAFLAQGRVELGVGVGWCSDEFDLVGQRFDARGRRTDEMLQHLVASHRAIAGIARTRELRAGAGLSMEDFTVLTPLTDAFTVEHARKDLQLD